jgi:hypothetical protein
MILIRIEVFYRAVLTRFLAFLFQCTLGGFIIKHFD